jgi:hypothetical protein
MRLHRADFVFKTEHTKNARLQRKISLQGFYEFVGVALECG